jgi:peptide chain release factor subunit 1
MVRSLARQEGDPAVVSLYLDVDGRHHPRPSDYTSNLERLIRSARQMTEVRNPRTAKTLAADLARIADWSAQDFDRATTRGLAVFSASRQGLFEAFVLPESVRDQVAVGPSPDVAQLVMLLAARSPVLFVVVDHQSSRLLRLGSGAPEEVDGPTDQVERQVDTDVELGSFERRQKEHARRHLRRVAHAVTDELGRRPACYIVLGGTPGVVAQLEFFLPKSIMELVAGQIALPFRTSVRDLTSAADDVVGRARRQRQRDVATALRDRGAQGEAAVRGLTPTLEALATGRVETLVVEEGFAAPGVRCGNCRALAAGDGSCPVCGSEVTPVDNVVDAAVGDAFVHHVDLKFCERGDLGDVGGIGAFTRLVSQSTT